MTSLPKAPASPRVTVVMPCYNAAATLEASIESVRRQAFEDWQLVVVDDGSSDRSPAIVEAWSQRDGRIRLERQANQGPSAARNRGVVCSQSEIVAFLDSDDLWESDHLAMTVAELDHTADLGVAFAPCRILDAAGNPTGEVTRPFPDGVTLADILACNPTATCSSLVVRRSVFPDAGPMRIDMVHAEDQEWLFRVLDAGWAIRSTGRASVGYRTSPSGLSANVERMQAGWQCFIRHALDIRPDIDDRLVARAHAHMQLYFARRRMRAGESGGVVLWHVVQAVQSSPSIVVGRPATVLGLALASVAPGLIEKLVHFRRSLRHA